MATLPKKIIKVAVVLYQQWISPFRKPQCRFYPSCSEYMLLAIEKYGVVQGVWKGSWRILRCNPLSHPKVDCP
ncbi:MAG: membrane protein insertion efficiency factor YidD [Candidatus Gribaldobacteria bacterium]|nr:membrane protein insertion efficiency factor YidD [Candidatus Gribaldobacteria bacterium]